MDFCLYAVKNVDVYDNRLFISCDVSGNSVRRVRDEEREESIESDEYRKNEDEDKD